MTRFISSPRLNDWKIYFCRGHLLSGPKPWTHYFACSNSQCHHQKKYLDIILKLDFLLKCRFSIEINTFILLILAQYTVYRSALNWLWFYDEMMMLWITQSFHNFGNFGDDYLTPTLNFVKRNGQNKSTEWLEIQIQFMMKKIQKIQSCW